MAQADEAQDTMTPLEHRRAQYRARCAQRAGEAVRVTRPAHTGRAVEDPRTPAQAAAAVPAPSSSDDAPSSVAAPDAASAPTAAAALTAADTAASSSSSADAAYAADANHGLPSLPFDRYLSQQRFHHIDTAFPGLQLVNEEPYIFLIRDFASAAECAALVARMRGGAAAARPSDGDALRTSSTSTSDGDARTSTSLFPREDDIGWLRARMARAAAVATRQLEPTKLSRYGRGGRFSKHRRASP